MRHVLKDEFDKYEKGEQVNKTLKDFLGDGIFASDGNTWKVHRKVSVQMFSRRLLEQGSVVAMAQARKLMARLDEAADSGETVDLQRCMYAFTMDTFAAIAFGVELDSQRRPHDFATAFDDCQRICGERFNDPLWEIE